MFGFFYFSLEGNGSFLSIKDAVTCLQHHVGYNLVRTRNFCQLIFPCLAARRRVACPRSPFRCLACHTGSACLSCLLGAGSRALGLTGVCVPKSPCPAAALLPEWGDLQRGAGLLCACSRPSCKSPVPWENSMFPGFSGDINRSSRYSNSSCTDPTGIPNVGEAVPRPRWWEGAESSCLRGLEANAALRCTRDRRA